MKADDSENHICSRSYRTYSLLTPVLPFEHFAQRYKPVELYMCSSHKNLYEIVIYLIFSYIKWTDFLIFASVFNYKIDSI